MDETAQKVRAIIAESLALEPEEVQLNSRLTAELGVTSLDFLDMVFALEGEFDIQIRDEELDLLTRADLPLDTAEEEGADGEFFPPKAVEILSKWVPEIANVPDPTRVARKDFFEMITVESIVLLVHHKMKDGNNDSKN